MTSPDRSSSQSPPSQSRPSQSPPSQSGRRGERRHPRGLYVLFATEAWERFSYYGMRALLVLYLVNHLEFARSEALEVYAVYTGLVYLTPIHGGFLADRWLGARAAIVVGGAVMALGHLAMAFESLLYPALGLLIVGNGFFKPNISTVVGALYEPGDPRRDGGFTIFYMGINLGAFFSPLVCGTLGEKVGWHYGFSAAGVGMVFGLLAFLRFQGLLGGAGIVRRPDEQHVTSLQFKDWRNIAIASVVSVALVFGAIEAWQVGYQAVASWPWAAKVVVGVVLIVGPLVVPSFRREPAAAAPPLTRLEWQRVAVIFVLFFFVIFFWMGFEQAGGTMTLFADEQTDRHAFGWEIPASYFQSINPLAIVLLAPLFSRMWWRLDQGRWRVSTPAKMALGMILLGLGFVVLYFGQSIAERTGTVGPQWLASVFVIHTLGELCLSPIGLSMVTKLSPPRIASLMMGLWFGSTAIANYLAGTLEAIVEKYDIGVFSTLIVTSIGAGVLLLVATPWLKPWMHGAD